MSTNSTRDHYYFDHAATGWPKPPGVVESMVEYQQEFGIALGRGMTDRARDAWDVVLATKAAIAAILETQHADSIALVSNGTMALNAALFGWLQPGDSVVTSLAEHNSMLRPLQALKQSRGIAWSTTPVNSFGAIDLDQLAAQLTPQTRMVGLSHAGNVTGIVQPLDVIVPIVRERAPNAWILLDAAQSVGYLPIEVDRHALEMVAAPGHKGLQGMQGTGFLYVSPRLRDAFRGAWIGGTGHSSDRVEGPFEWVSAIESGNLNGPAIASLLAGCRWLQDSVQQTDPHWLRHFLRLQQLLSDVPFWTPITPKTSTPCVPILSLKTTAMLPQEWATLLDGSFGIETRAGLHCAGLVHQALGTDQCGGTLRFSLGHTTTDRDLLRLEEAIREIRSTSW